MFLQFFNPNNSGSPASGFKLFTYVAGTSTKQATWTDSTQLVQNTNPVIADANGVMIVWLDPTLFYKLVLASPTDTDPPTSPIYSVDNIQGFVTVSMLTQTFIGNVLYPIIAAESGVTVVNPWYGYGVIDRYGTNTTPGSTNMLSAINAAIAVMSVLGGGVVQGLSSIYLHNGNITMLPGVTVQGEGKNATVFLSSHTGSGIVNTMTPNASNNADTEIRNCTFKNTNSANIGGGLVDNAGTFVRGRNVRVNGFAYSRIFNQSELADDDLMDYEGFLVGGVWLTNGGDFTPGANPGFTNRVSINRSQFNSAAAGAIGIIDDGGANHSYTDNNYNAALHHYRIAGCKNVTISRGEWETATSANILFRSTTSVLGTSVGPTDQATIQGIWASPVAGTAITFTAAPTGSSGTLTANWGNSTGQYNISFSDGENRTATLTNGSTAVTWTVALTGSPTATGNTAIPVVADIASGSLTALVALGNRFITSAPTIVGVPTLNAVTAIGNQDSNAGIILDGVAANHLETAVAKGKIITNGNFGVNGVTSPPAQSTGWGTPTGASVVTSLTCGAGASLTTVSEAVGQIILYLKSRGDFGS